MLCIVYRIGILWSIVFFIRFSKCDMTPCVEVCNVYGNKGCAAFKCVFVDFCYSPRNINILKTCAMVVSIIS